MTQHKQQSAAFAKLKATLKIPHYQAVGIVECIKFWESKGLAYVTCERLAEMLEWDGSPDDLYAACVDCGWLVVVNRNN